jgi:hypothetical protein
LRNQLFHYLATEKIPWTYDAQFVEGFSNHFSQINDLAGKNDSSQERFKVSQNLLKESLHTQLFDGVFTKSLAWGFENLGDSFDISIEVDTVDRPILKNFQNFAAEFTGFRRTKTHEVKAFDTQTQSIVKGSISITMSIPTDYDLDFSKISHSIKISDSPSILAADVLSNSILYLLNQKQDATPLNNFEAISSHPISHLAFPRDPGTIPDAGDVLFSHPQRER